MKHKPNAYILFVKANRALIKKENPSATFGEISKLLAKKWNAEKIKPKLSKKQKTSHVQPIDPFDEIPATIELFKGYYNDNKLEKMLRMAIFNDYAYNYIQKLSDRKVLFDEVRNGPDSFLDSITDSFVMHDLVKQWYNHFNPTHNIDIDAKLTEYMSGENVLFGRLYKKYVDPQWDEYTELWF